jgi:long-chain-fatty-acid--[acyl-carrier-protein] ligase
VPKGVPLSHFNVLKNIIHALETLKVQDTDVFYGFLPPFHSFGFTVTSILPVISGIRCAYYPNPTDSRRLAAGVEKWQISLMCGTPSFLRGILKAVASGQGKSLRYLLAGAEKADDELFSLVENLQTGARLLEGYGITECSPIITVNHEDKPRAGVGYPLKSTELLIVDIDSLTPVAQGERGLILVSGDSVFSGYLDASKNPFVTVGEQSYYNTGDLGYLSPDGALFLAGRLKRFVKVAGEMISLPAMEDALLEFFPATEDGPSFAVEALEKDGERPIIALFVLKPEELETVNSNLRAKGFSAVGRINQIKVLPKIPLLGTGKTDYRSLKAILTEA